MLTIIALGDSVLNPPAFGKVRYLGPILIRIGTGAESAAGTICGGELRRAMVRRSIWIAVLALHHVYKNSKLKCVLRKSQIKTIFLSMLYCGTKIISLMVG